MEFYTHGLSNGIRLIHKPVQSAVAHCGITVSTGSRDELESQHGLAHFVEHMIFKGTAKRKAYHILSRMEDVGGDINAYTSKEETCIHTTFYNNYYKRAFELLSDILFYSNFPQKQIHKEKEVIIDEINSYKDSPYDQIHDEVEEQIFKGQPISKNILGNSDALNVYTRDDLLAFYRSNYATDEIVVSSVGNVSYSKILKHFIRYFADVPIRKRKKLRIPFNKKIYIPSNTVRKTDNFQSHCVYGNLSYSYHNDKRLTLHLINSLLGGNGMNSRLNLALRENGGMAYNVESNYTSYSDTGVFYIYFGTEKEKLNKCLSWTKKELKKLRERRLGSMQLLKSKRQLIGQIAISAENNENQMLNIGKSLLVYNKVESLDTVMAKINSITDSDILEVANEVLDENNFSLLIHE